MAECLKQFRSSLVAFVVAVVCVCGVFRVGCRSVGVGVGVGVVGFRAHRVEERHPSIVGFRAPHQTLATDALSMWCTGNTPK